MLQSLVIWSFCLLIGLAALAACGWVAVSGQLLTMDGLLLVAISLTLGGAFVGNFLWSMWRGEVREVLSQLRHKRTGAEREGATACEVGATKGE